jgi:hypothetical protein
MAVFVAPFDEIVPGSTWGAIAGDDYSFACDDLGLEGGIPSEPLPDPQKK